MENASYLKSLMKKARGQESDPIAIPAYEKTEASPKESNGSAKTENRMKESFVEPRNGSDNIDTKKGNSKKGKKASDKHFSKLINELKDKTIEGEKKRLIRFEDKSENVLKLLQVFYSVDITVLVNYIVDDFFLQNPELIAEIKQSIKSIDL